MSHASADAQFEEKILATYFDYEAGKITAETCIKTLELYLVEVEKTNNPLHKGKVLEYLGIMEYLQDNVESARLRFEMARRIYMQLQAYRLIGMLELNLGSIFLAKSWYARSKDSYYRAYAVAIRYDYTALQAFALNNLGHLYYRLEDYRIAQQTLEKAYSLGQVAWSDFDEEESHNQTKYRQVNNVNLEENFALVAFAQGLYEIAWEHCQTGLTLAMEYELKLNQAHFLRLLAQIITAMPSLESKMQPQAYYLRAIQKYSELNVASELALTYLAYAQILYTTDLHAASAALGEAIKWAIKASLVKDLVTMKELEIRWRNTGK